MQRMEPSDTDSPTDTNTCIVCLFRLLCNVNYVYNYTLEAWAVQTIM